MHDEMQSPHSQMHITVDIENNSEQTSYFLQMTHTPLFGLTQTTFDSYLNQLCFRISETICTCWYPFCQIILFQSRAHRMPMFALCLPLVLLELPPLRC